MIDYETSLQAPGVREVLGRLKRAFKRIFPQTELETIAKFTRHPGRSEGPSDSPVSSIKRDLGERLVLIPIAQSVPPDSSDQYVQGSYHEETTESSRPKAKTSVPFWFVGEHYENSRYAWKSVSNSAMAVVKEMKAQSAPRAPVFQSNEVAQ